MAVVTHHASGLDPCEKRLRAHPPSRRDGSDLASNDPDLIQRQPADTATLVWLRVRPRSAISRRQRAACTVAARSGRRYRFLVMRLVLSWRPVTRARPAQGDGGIAATAVVSASTAGPGLTRSPVSPSHASGRCAVVWPWWSRTAACSCGRVLHGPARRPDVWSSLVPDALLLVVGPAAVNGVDKPVLGSRKCNC